MKYKIALEIIYFLFILLFLYAALIKIIDVDKFQGQIGQSTMLTHYAGFLSLAVPITELLLVLLLVIKRFRVIGLYLSMAAMTMFTGYVFYVQYFDPNIPCSCGGILESMGWGAHLIFNFSFLVLSIAGIYLDVKLNRADRYEATSY